MNGRNDEVTIWASQMRPDGLPPICVKTGQPTHNWRRVTFQTAPRWTIWLLVAGLLVIGVWPYLIVRRLLSVRARGHLPFDRGVARRINAFLLSGFTGLIVGAVIFVLGAGASSGGMAAIGAVIFFAGFALLIALRTQVPVAVVRKQPEYPNDRVVVLRRLHPNFVMAVQAQQQAAVQQQAPVQQQAYSPPIRN